MDAATAGDQGTAAPTAIRPSPGRGRAPQAQADTSNAHPPDPIRSSLSASRHHRGNHFGLTKRASRKRPNPCRNPISAGPASSLCVSYGPCSSVPASGCHHRPVPGCRPSKAAAPGHGKLGRNSRVTLSGRSADNLESGRPDNPPVSLIIHRQPSTARQSSIANYPTRRKGAAFPMPTALSSPTRRRLPRCPRPPNPPS